MSNTYNLTTPLIVILVLWPVEDVHTSTQEEHNIACKACWIDCCNIRIILSQQRDPWLGGVLHALHPKLINTLPCTYISVMFSMSSNGSTGKSSIPGTESIQTILEMVQVQDLGQASLNLQSPIKTKNNPTRAMPYSPALESMAGSNEIPRSQTKCVQIVFLFKFPPSSVCLSPN